ncbi:MAG: RNase adapter RapZ [Alphaproteobacteria bacterium]
MIHDKKNDIYIITGYSGAGMSSVLKTLEDMGIEVFDNFPLTLVAPLMDNAESKHKKIAIGIDTRTRGFSPEAVLETTQNLNAHLIFISCEDNELQRRYTETRRRHPLAKEKSVRYGIQAEHKILDELKRKSDLILDTTTMSVHDLRHALEGHFNVKPQSELTITLMSFGFKYGIPREADIVMDVRFLKNPHWEPDLKPKTGLDNDVGKYIQSDDMFEQFLHNFKALIEPLLPRYAYEGKKYFTIAIGCTGGRHRSVYTVENLAEWLRETGSLTHIEHRDIEN